MPTTPATLGFSDYTALFTTTLARYAEKTLTDNIFASSVILTKIKESGRYLPAPGGVFILEPLLFGKNATVKSHDPYETISVTPQEGIGAAGYLWKEVSGSVVISDRELAENKGEQAVINLMQSKITQAEGSLQEEIATQLFADGTGNSGKDLIGLAAINSNTITLGGIAPGTYTWWKPGSLTGSVGAVTLKVIGNSITNATKAPNRPDLIVTTGLIWDSLANTLQGQQRYVDKDAKLADAGFENFTIRGIPVVWDELQAAQTIDFLTTKNMALRYHPDWDFKTTEMQRPPNAKYQAALVSFMGNITVNRRKSFARQTGVTP